MHEFCFYLDWAGWKPEVWAAWTQALVALAVGFAAIYIPWEIARQERVRRLGAALSLCGITAFQFLQAADEAAHGANDAQLYKFHLQEGNEMLKALGEIPTHELLEWQVIETRRLVESRCRDLEAFLAPYLDEDFAFSEFPESLKDELEFRVRLIRTSMKSIADQLGDLRPFWRRWLRRKST